MKTALRWGSSLLVGGVSYWIPDIAIQFLRPPQTAWILLLTFLVPAVVAAAWFWMSRRPRHRDRTRALSLMMLLGVWLFAPVGAAIGMIPSGATFFEPGNIKMLLELWASFPFTTLLMTTYSGSFGGIGVVTLLLLLGACLPARPARR